MTNNFDGILKYFFCSLTLLHYFSQLPLSTLKNSHLNSPAAYANINKSVQCFKIISSQYTQLTNVFNPPKKYIASSYTGTVLFLPCGGFLPELFPFRNFRRNERAACSTQEHFFLDRQRITMARTTITPTNNMHITIAA